METISEKRRIEELRVKLKFSNCFSVDRVGNSGGLAVFWDSKLECRIFGFSRNHIDLVFEESGIDSWRLSCFYGIPNRNCRKESWNFLRALSKLSSIPWCVVGDFNDMLYVEDKEGVHPHPQALLEGFGRAVNDCELLELDLCGGRFTWEKSRDSDKWVQEKLDRAFATISW